MKKGIYKIAILVSLANFVSCILGGITIITSVFRSVIVFIGTLFLFSIFLILLRWGLNSEFFVKDENVNNPEVNNE